MLKKNLALLLAAFSFGAYATDFYVVVPVKNRTAAPTIKVALNSYTLPSGTAGQVYPGFDFKPLLQVTGDSAFSSSQVTWSLASGALPEGLSLNATTGVLSGTPTAGGTSTFAVKATYKTQSGQHNYQVFVSAVTISLNVVTLPMGKLNKAYAAFDFGSLLTVNDPNKDLTNLSWSISGSLPAGMNFNTSTGVLSGTPTQTWGNTLDITASYKLVNSSATYRFDVGAAILDATYLKAGSGHTCAVNKAGGVWCWGANAAGQLGTGNTTTSPWPLMVSGLQIGALKVAPGDSHTCALKNDGTVVCWGSNQYGQLGDGTTTNRLTPVAVSGLSGVTDLQSGGKYTCALTSGGLMKCWGYNASGQLGDGTVVSKSAPTTVPGLTGIASMSVGPNSACAMSGGYAYCWGNNSSGQLGDGTTTQRISPTYAASINSLGLASVAMATSHACALTKTNLVRCWGFNGNGELGIGSTTNSVSPVAPGGQPSATYKSVYTMHAKTFAVKTDGTVLGWGFNWNGDLGVGNLTQMYTSPVAITALGTNQVLDFSGGYAHACALMTDNTVKCWGAGSQGALGDGTTTSRTSPTTVAN